MRRARFRFRWRVAGFSLVELAIVLFVVGLLMLSLMSTLSSQVEQRNFDDTRRRLEQARELLLAYAIVNGRLPCPARSTSAGAEVRDVATGQCTSGGVEDYYGGALASGATGGLLPAQTIGFQLVDGAGFAIDAWQNRIRYAVAKLKTNCSVPLAPAVLVDPHFVSAANMRSNGIACQPNDLLVCKSAAPATGITGAACGGPVNQIMTQGLVVAIIFSTGKNFSSNAAGASADEATNLKTNGALAPLINPIFVFHTPTPGDAVNGEFDDQFTWITAGELYGKLISAGVLP